MVRWFVPGSTKELGCLCSGKTTDPYRGAHSRRAPPSGGGRVTDTAQVPRQIGFARAPRSRRVAPRGHGSRPRWTPSLRVNPWGSKQWRVDPSGSRPLIVIWGGGDLRDFRFHIFQSPLSLFRDAQTE